ncbi:MULTISPECIES: DUF503 family protein [unclassified Psychrobacter]|uniref:DUF503 family protein n=1 Tax=unclassified Psychrobacter TaxID=196806 RepID=UPI003F96245B
MRRNIEKWLFWTLSFLFRVRSSKLYSFGNTPSVAVWESDERDRHDASKWTFVIVGLSKREVESQCSQIEDKIKCMVDARVMNVEREFI